MNSCLEDDGRFAGMSIGLDCELLADGGAEMLMSAGIEKGVWMLPKFDDCMLRKGNYWA